MSKHFNNLTPAEAERLVLVAEECGEIIQVIGKILRHGYESSHPDTPSLTNRKLLEKELGDLNCASSLISLAKDVDKEAINAHQAIKVRRIWQYLHHNSPQDFIQIDLRTKK